MFLSYDLKNYGIELRKIRLSMGLSQFNVNLLTGINQDTLRRIENGTVIPKYETLEILSNIYKSDLLDLLRSHRNNRQFYSYYDKIDNIIACNDIHLINPLIEEYKNSIQNQEMVNLLISKSEIKQFECFLEGLKMYFSTPNDDWYSAIDILLNALSLTVIDFKIDNYLEYKYSLFEIRILLLIALILEKLKEYEISTNILVFSIDYLVCASLNNINTHKLIITLYTNISYNYHKTDEHMLALTYANKGIDFAVSRSNVHGLYLLYARKGIAEHFLCDGNYIDSLKKSIHILEICKLNKLSEHYKNVFYKKYKITLFFPSD